jgi:hypothetical protein
MSMIINKMKDCIMNNCATCKHWKPYEFNDRLASDWAECKIAEGRKGLPVLTESIVFAFDASDYHAQLATRGDFGCVLHEELIK